MKHLSRRRLLLAAALLLAAVRARAAGAAETSCRLLRAGGVCLFQTMKTSLRSCLLLLAFAASARAATFTVTTAADQFDTPSGTSVSLREALRDAEASAGADTITFAPALSGQTITLTGPDQGTAIAINDAGGVTIDATSLPGGLTIQRNSSDTHEFSLFISANGTSLTLRGLTLANGGGSTFSSDGGAIYNFGGTLTLTQCSLSGNSSGLNGNGGAIFNQGTLTLTHCTLSGNSANAGGAVASVNNVTLVHCTVSGNTATFGGGGLNCDGALSVTNSIIAGNTAPADAGPDLRGDGGVKTLTGVNIIPTAAFVNGAAFGGSGTRLTADPLLSALASNGGPTQTMALQPGSPARNATVGSSATTDQRGYPIAGTADIGAFEVQDSTVTLESSTTPAVYGQSVTFTATVSAGPSGAATPTGTVIFTLDGNAGSPVALNGSGQATFTTSALSAGLHALSAAYSGDALALPGTSGTLVQTVNKANVVISLTTNPDPLRPGLDTTFTATLAAAAPGAVTPTGSVTFTINGTTGSPVTLTGGSASTLLSGGLPLGSHTIVISGYAGDANYNSSSGASFTVESVSDYIVSNRRASGPGSLDWTLINARQNPGPDTITFLPGLSAPITLGSEILITDLEGVTVDASAVPGGVTLQGNGGRLISISNNSIVTLLGLHFTGGNGVGARDNGSGGALYNNNGTLTLTRCTFSGNTATVAGGALYQFLGTLTMTDCTLSDNSATAAGGALDANGPTTLTRCTLARNAATDGGGIYSFAALTMTQCTLADNAATGTGGALYANSNQQPIKPLDITHCTVSRNSAPYGGGILSGFVNLTMRNSVVAGNSRTGAAQDGADLVTSRDYTLVGANVVQNLIGATNLGIPPIQAAPLLNALGDYGGLTHTMPPQPGSPALDQAAVLNPTLTTDQRGLPRPIGLRPDIGAVEGSIIVVTTPLDELDAPGALGNGVSLHEAVRDVPVGGMILFDRAVFNSSTTNTITLTKGPLNPQRNCTLNGSLNPGGITIVQVPTITQQPQPLSLASGANANFAITVTNLSGGVAYQWRKDGSDMAGQNAAALALANVQQTDESFYDVRLSEASSPGILTLNNVVLNAFAATSQPASLIVDGAPVYIQRNPISAMLALGSSHTLSVVAIGPATAALTYQWTLNGKNISGATSRTYSIAKAALTHAGTYRCEVKSGTTPVTSDPAEIGVVDTTPKTFHLAVGGAFSASVNAAGNGITYAWLKNGGSTVFNTKSFPIKSVAVADAGLYTCTVTGAAGVFTGGAPTLLTVSNAAPQFVLPLALPAATIGQAYFYQLPVQNIVGAPATSFSVTGALPAGIVFNTTTGILSGRPTATKTGGYALNFKAINAKTSSALAPATLTVNVVPSNAVGVFAGPIERSPLNDNLGGRFDLTTTATGLCSGSITLGARAKLIFANQLLLSAGAGDVILRANIPGITMADKTPLTAYIEVFAVEQLARLTLIHPNGTTLVIPAWRNPWHKTNLATAYTAYYTLRLDPQDLGTAPRGYGYASFTVKPDGTLTLAGKLPDGSDVTGGTFVGPEGQILLFNLLYANRGSHVGQFNVTAASPVTNNAINGITSWFKPAPLPTSTDTVYKAGFGPLNVTAAGGVYVPPAKGLRVMGLLTVPNPNAKLAFTLGGLAPEFSQLLNIVNPSANGLTNTAVITAPVTNTTKLPTLDAAKGLFAGSFQINGATAALHRPAPYFGQIVKIGASTQGYGYFLLPTATPKISTSPKLSGRVVLGVP